MENNRTEMKPEDLEQAAGGTFNPNKFTAGEYARAGIKVVTHLLAKDEFWWKGENIGEVGANTVMYFFEKTGKEPATLEQATLYMRRYLIRG